MNMKEMKGLGRAVMYLATIVLATLIIHYEEMARGSCGGWLIELLLLVAAVTEAIELKEYRP